MAQTLKQRRKQQGGKKGAAVEITKARAISNDEEWLAAFEGSTATEKAPVPGESEGMTSGGVITHTRPGLVRMYKPDGHGRYEPRNVPSSMLRVNLANGFLAACPSCHSKECEGGNSCAARLPQAVRRCPVCGKRILDNYNFPEADTSDEPGLIRDEAYDSSTPESRTKAQLDRHLWFKHPTEASSMSIAAPPTERATPLEAASAVSI